MNAGSAAIASAVWDFPTGAAIACGLALAGPAWHLVRAKAATK